ncbi:hypothetical protein [Bosea sp. (in: a-proteobacteria)]|uniref:hypothetical protein n=1 Tax=Bosea sp. (in: a-proteobacteria) TaxID=1871050 RepID=UPI0025C69A48|nr:hypothetical protein [Bosea sp. (in: a-proteobacteria)]MBR3190443.1 hypothetical protein [Bosea sp. (in: a-proteobacteria)]
MTAVNAFIRGQKAYIFTDGRVYTRDGDPLGSSQKVEIMAHLPAVLTARGQTWIRSAMAFHCAEQFNSFDELLAGITHLLEKTREGLGVPRDASVLKLTLAGWSHEREQMELWTVSDADRPGVPAFHLHEIIANVSPLDDRLMRDAQAAGLDIENGEPEALGLAFLRMQRDRAWPVLHTGRMVEGIGVFAQMTVVHQDRIETRILERWEDAA